MLSYDGRLIREALVPSESSVTPRENTGGRVLPSKEKNSKDAPSQRTAWIVERKPLFSLRRSQAADVSSCYATRWSVHGGPTVCFGDYLPDGVESLVAGTDLKLDFDEEDGEGAADFELVFDSAACGHATGHDCFRRVPDEESEFGLDTA